MPNVLHRAAATVAACGVTTAILLTPGVASAAAPAATADLSVKIISRSSTFGGSGFNLHVVAKNAGPATEKTVSVTLTAPEGWTIVSAPGSTSHSSTQAKYKATNLGAGQSVNYPVRLTAPDTGGGQYRFTATARGTVTDPAPDDNSAGRTVTVFP